MYLCSKLLQPSNINGSFLRGKQVAAPHTKVRCGTNHPTGQTQGVVRKDGTCCPIVVLVHEYMLTYTNINERTFNLMLITFNSSLIDRSSSSNQHSKMNVSIFYSTLLEMLVINDLMSRLVGQLF